jgi:hypothetical protein
MIHVSVHSFVKEPGIKLLYDVFVLCEKNVDWHTVLKYAQNDGYEYRVAIVAYLAKNCLNANIPDEIFMYNITERRIKKLLNIIVDYKEYNILYLKNNVNILEILRIEAYSDNKSLLIFIIRKIIISFSRMIQRAISRLLKLSY